ncbi:hypothetical protein D9757_005551 [Collybiopsis confluens]|uniref:Zinc-finger domain-containing protein n=1 Tax=Collybiopsis confluens TaxID=2823264 RepID=A0A8H5HLD7_9AGAR|nr:hypothetical protein D9757_005551 [Collybiopsis confluens]
MDIQNISAVAPNPATALDDAASSLRAAALLTLKSNKRRKPNDVDAVQPSRPIFVDNSVLLDYGHDDIASSPPEFPVQTYVRRPRTSSPKHQSAREEGEISDNEAPSSSFSPMEDDQPRSAIPLSPAKPHATPSTPFRDTHFGDSRSHLSAISSKLESPPHNLLDRLTDNPAPMQEVEHSPTSYFVDPDHVRPGLEMNQEEYDTAKDIILDLLGWGVPPEYLVDCGLSREIVFYVFSELNLRLPDNLNPEGIIPYAPSTFKSLLRPNGISSPYSSDSGGSRLADRLSMPIKHSAPSQDDSRDIFGRSSAVLQDMERQRRQELFARKAVQASRKTQNTGSASPPSKSQHHNEDVEMAPPAPSESVDDFLKSIEPTSPAADGASGPSLASTPIHTTQQEPMQIDSNGLVDSPSDETSTMTFPEDHSSASGQTAAPDDTADSSNGGQRRNSKRPVAADFVDFETSPRRNGPSLKRKSGEADDEDVRMKPIPSGGPSRVPSPPMSNSALRHRTKSPADLAAKEMEIQKMRQMIAEREQGRVKKIKALSGSDAIVVKQEEGDSTVSLAQPSGVLAETVSFGTPIGPVVFGLLLPQLMSSIGSTGALDTSTLSSPDQSGEEKGPENGGNVFSRASRRRRFPVFVGTGAFPEFVASQHHRELDEKVPQPEDREAESIYHSIFDSYPLLRSRSRPLLPQEPIKTTLQYSYSSSPSISSIIPSSSATYTYSHLPSFFLSRRLAPSALPDLQPLRLATLACTVDPSRRICRYEIPGGGICRDAGCEDIHIGRLGGGTSAETGPALPEPDDQNTANYLATAIPDSWITTYGDSLVSRLVTALEDIRLKHPTLTLEERVARICDMMGPHSPTT